MPDLREFAIKSLGDRKRSDPRADASAVAPYLSDPEPRVRLQAVIALGKIGQTEFAPQILPLTADPDLIVAHVAVKALVALDAGEACLKGLDDPKLAPGATKVAVRRRVEAPVLVTQTRVV